MNGTPAQRENQLCRKKRIRATLLNRGIVRNVHSRRGTEWRRPHSQERERVALEDDLGKDTGHETQDRSSFQAHHFFLWGHKVG